MKNYIVVALLSFVVILPACKKHNNWDVALNGHWEEYTSSNAKSLPSGCDIIFNDNQMLICYKSLTASLNSKSKILSANGQIWIDYNLAFRNHLEYRYDYQFDGQYLWLIEETTNNFNGAINKTNAKKYSKK